MLRPWLGEDPQDGQQRARSRCGRRRRSSSGDASASDHEAPAVGVRAGRGRGTASGCPAGRRSRRPAPPGRRGAAARGERTAAAPRSPRVRDGLAGAGGVVGRQELPGPRAQERLGLAERLDVRVDALDVLEPLAGQRREAQADRHDDLARDLEVVLDEQVVVLADGAVDDVLDRDDAGRGLAGRDRVEDRAEAADRGRARRRRTLPGRRPRRTRRARRHRRRARSRGSGDSMESRCACRSRCRSRPPAP